MILIVGLLHMLHMLSTWTNMFVWLEGFDYLIRGVVSFGNVFGNDVYNNLLLVFLLDVCIEVSDIYVARF